MKTKAKISLSKDVYETTLLTLSTNKSFNAVINDLEKQLGRFDPVRIEKAGKRLPQTIKEMEGSSGLMILATIEMGQTLPTFVKESTRARQYLIGNPSIADKMARHDKRAALYAPPRVLVYTDNEQTFISYDQPSTVFCKFPSKEIRQVAEDLDEKFARLIEIAFS